MTECDTTVLVLRKAGKKIREIAEMMECDTTVLALRKAGKKIREIAEMMECDTTVLALRKAGKKIREIAEMTGLSYNEVNYRLLVLAKNGMIERRRKKLGRMGLSREDFADVIAETEDMRARGEI